MTDKTLDELQRELDNLTDATNNFTASTSAAGRSSGILTAANNAASAAAKAETLARKRSRERLKQTYEELISETLAVGSSLTGSQGNLDAVKGIVGLAASATTGLVSAAAKLVPTIGEALSKIAESSGKQFTEIANLVVDQFGVSWNSYKNLTDKGVVKSISDMASLAEATALRYEQIDATVGKYSALLSTVNSSQLRGTDGFKRLAKASAGIREEFYGIGINAENFAEFQLQYVAETQQLGSLKGQSDLALVAGTKRYIENLNTQTQLFGVSRKEQLAIREKAMQNDKFRASLTQLANELPAAMAETVKQRALNLNTALDKVAPEISEGVLELFASNGIVTSQVSAKLEVNTGGQASKIMQQFRAGQITDIEARNLIIDALKDQSLKTRHIAAVTNDAIVGQNYAKNQDLIAQGKRTKEEEKLAEAAAKQKDELSKTMASGTRKLEESSSEIQRFITTSKEAARMIGFAAAGADLAAKTINKYIGKSSNQPEPTPPTSSTGGAPAGSSGGTSGTAPATKPSTPATGSSGGTSGTAPATKPSTPTTGAAIDPAAVINFSSNSGNRESFDKLQPSFRDRVLVAAQDYFSITGKKINLNSAARTREQQEKLYSDFKSGKSKLPAAPPDRSLHVAGMAVDIQNYTDAQAIAAFNRQGLVQGVANDPPHFQLEKARTGGIFSGKDKYTVELHGEEEVYPVVNNKIQRPGNLNMVKKLKSVYSMTERHLNDMISSLESSDTTQRRLIHVSF